MGWNEGGREGCWNRGGVRDPWMVKLTKSREEIGEIKEGVRFFIKAFIMQAYVRNLLFLTEHLRDHLL